MKLDEMMIGEFKELAQLFQTENKSKTNIGSCMVGKVCIARCYATGVYAGEVAAVEGENVVLKNALRLLSWEAKNSIALSGLAQTGLSVGKVGAANPEIYLTGVCELIPCTAIASYKLRQARSRHGQVGV